MIIMIRLAASGNPIQSQVLIPKLSYKKEAENINYYWIHDLILQKRMNKSIIDKFESHVTSINMAENRWLSLRAAARAYH
jgi:hypothetical protein